MLGDWEPQAVGSDSGFLQLKYLVVSSSHKAVMKGKCPREATCTSDVTLFGGAHTVRDGSVDWRCQYSPYMLCIPQIPTESLVPFIMMWLPQRQKTVISGCVFAKPSSHLKGNKR